jgi:hypothetical protein
MTLEARTPKAQYPRMRILGSSGPPGVTRLCPGPIGVCDRGEGRIRKVLSERRGGGAPGRPWPIGPGVSTDLGADGESFILGCTPQPTIERDEVRTPGVTTTPPYSRRKLESISRP